MERGPGEAAAAPKGPAMAAAPPRSPQEFSANWKALQEVRGTGRFTAGRRSHPGAGQGKPPGERQGHAGFP